MWLSSDMNWLHGVAALWVDHAGRALPSQMLAFPLTDAPFELSLFIGSLGLI